jgi:hypothetical protein
MSRIPKRSRPAQATDDLTELQARGLPHDHVLAAEGEAPEAERTAPPPRDARGEAPEGGAERIAPPPKEAEASNSDIGGRVRQATSSHDPSEDESAISPASPAGNRARFMSGLQPNKVSCDLSTAPLSPGLRFSFEAVIVVVYPATTTAPERRYIELMDQFGTTGITLWNNYVHAVSPLTVGCICKFTRLALAMHNGKKNLTMAKDSTFHVEMPTYQGMLATWWHSLLNQPIINCIQFHDSPALEIVNISGVLGHIQVEEKIVKGAPKNLLVLFLTDRTGKMEIRSWNHSDTEFLPYKERPVLLKRVRVCLYAGTRTGELLTGTHGSTITTKFDNEDLKKYWAE